jgi:hypothetical protein
MGWCSSQIGPLEIGEMTQSNLLSAGERTTLEQIRIQVNMDGIFNRFFGRSDAQTGGAASDCVHG